MKCLTPSMTARYYLKPTFTIPLLTAAVVIVIVLLIAFICVRKIRQNANNSGCEFLLISLKSIQ